MANTSQFTTTLKKILIFTALIAGFLTGSLVKAAEAPEALARDIYFRAKVVVVEKEEVTEELTEPLLTQTIRLLLTSGDESGKEVIVEYQVRGAQSTEKKLQPNDTVVVDKNILPDGTTNYYVTEPFRLNALAWLGFLFFAITIGIAGRRGLFAFFGLITTFAIIVWFIIPQISQGASPFLICLVGAALIAGVSLGLGHGFTRQTAVALGSIVITIVLAMILSVVAVSGAHLFGLGSEEAYYLQYGFASTINLRGLLLGGIIIGVLGVLDDVAMAQVAVVAELRAANPLLSPRELYGRASRIGREHIVAVVNTLVLAYVGAAFPLVLMFQTFTTPWWVTLNTELISEEVVRTLIGSISLVAAVPIATALAVWYYHRKI